jgi:mono/diheme cytochrome c family protein
MRAGVASALAIVAAALLWLSLGGKSGQAAPPPAAKSAALFVHIATVLQSPRCMNCHTDTAHPFPRQGDDRHRHLFNVQRGPDGLGAPGLHCSTCHQPTNNVASGVPGAAGWRLAPLSMAWEGLSVAQICRELVDRTRNGGRDAAALADHFAHETLVNWAWSPGVDHNGRPRTPPPLSHDEFNRLVEGWLAAGMACPQ